MPVPVPATVRDSGRLRTDLEPFVSSALHESLGVRCPEQAFPARVGFATTALDHPICDAQTREVRACPVGADGHAVQPSEHGW